MTFIKVADAAKQLGTTVQVVNKWARDGRIPSKEGPDGRRVVDIGKESSGSVRPRAARPRPSGAGTVGAKRGAPQTPREKEAARVAAALEATAATIGPLKKVPVERKAAGPVTEERHQLLRKAGRLWERGEFAASSQAVAEADALLLRAINEIMPGVRSR